MLEASDERIDQEERDDRCTVHVHTYLTETDVSEEHQHEILGVTAPARKEGTSHVHRLRIRSSYLIEEPGEGHWHWVDVITGPAIKIGDCGHIHCFSGETCKSDCHEHTFGGVTGLGPVLNIRDDE